MDPTLLCLMFFVVVHHSSVCAKPHPSNGLQECRKNLSLLALEVLPGGGWDNLRNKDMGRVMNFSYSQCQTTEDGVYLIPDEVFVIPQRTTAVERSSEVFEHWLNHTSSTSQTINADASFLPVLSGKFSSDSQQTKTYQVRDNSVTSRVQVRNHIYTVDNYPDFTLDSRFIEQVKEIADALLKNNTRRATFLSEMMVVDYGTHVITSVDAGAILEQEDHVESTYYQTSEKSLFSSTAGLNFFKIIKFDMDTKESQETTQTLEYKTHVTHSLTQSHGGPVFYPGITLKTWQESTLNNLVAIDRSGLPLHYILNRATLPDLPDTIIESVAQSVRNATQLYYDVNTRPGCVDSSSANFNFQANVDDNSCLGPATNLSFGGIYQTCTPLTGGDAAQLCVGQEQMNPDTGAYSCREPYFSTLLQSVVIEEHYSYTECHDDCESFCLFDCCDRVCNTWALVRKVEVKTYWCATDKFTKPRSGYLFGGLYSPYVENPLTRSKSCPLYFFPLTFLSNDFKICLSNDYEQASSLSVPFGGFFSCRAGNPLAWFEHRCPPQFSQHLATIDDGCQILYCVKSGAFTGGQLKPINLPPFTHPELIRKVDNKTMIMVTEGDQVWLRRGDSNSWKRAETGEVAKYVRQLHTSAGGQIAAGFLVTFSIILAIGVAYVVKRKFGSLSRREGYGTLLDTGV
ncbi:macrophage-expressed gene 1 protein-like [Sardina pilchardus]|uniref:macrophage-expressed gene 1 protein-like n=1 Tax=Sardina pilchardus TaxID=27697 RepID=UPI002E104070